MRKKSIFNLPYWRTHLWRRNVYIMHVEKNICNMLLGTLLDIKGKTKDTSNGRREIMRIKIRKELQSIRKGDNR